jgi:hypothetical protein
MLTYGDVWYTGVVSNFRKASSFLRTSQMPTLNYTTLVYILTKPLCMAGALAAAAVVGNIRTRQIAPDYLKATLKADRSGARQVPHASRPTAPCPSQQCVC